MTEEEKRLVNGRKLQEAENIQLKADIKKLQEENTKLRVTLDLHGIQFPDKDKCTINSQSNMPPVHVNDKSISDGTISKNSPTALKIGLFKSLFRGREGVYSLRWTGKKGSGYSPVCVNLWNRPLCKKPKMKCSDCSHRQYSEKKRFN